MNAMTTPAGFRIRSQSAELRHARALLAALSDGRGPQALPATEALATVDLTHPPYPPVDELPDPGAVTPQQAFEALAAAALVAADPAEAARLAEASLALRTPLPS
jgi:hypothetical protein